MTPKDILIAKMFSKPAPQTIPAPVGTDMGEDVSATGKPVNGDGTGTSDDVPAEVTDENDGSTAPAKLSKDEFVVPAHIVRKLGQGNAQIGAQVLQQMLSDIAAKSDNRMKGTQVPKGLQSLLGAS